MNFRRLVIIAISLSLAWAQKGQKPVDSGVVINTEAREVLVDAVVTGKKGEYIRDLEAKDFRVWEDNKEQTVKSFSFGADAASPANSQKRYLILFFDNASMDQALQPRARQAAAKFVESNAGPNRLMAVINFGGSLQIAQNFTDDAERLKRVLSGVKFASVDPNDPNTDATKLSSAAADFAMRDALMALRRLAKNLGAVPGRKTLILLTGGFPVNSEQLSEVTATIAACNKANVAIYPIDVRGLKTLEIPAPRAGLFGVSPSAFLQLASFSPGRTGGFGTAFFQRGGGGSAGGGAGGGGGAAGGGGGVGGGGGGGGGVGGGGGRGGGFGGGGPVGGGAPGGGARGGPTGPGPSGNPGLGGGPAGPGGGFPGRQTNLPPQMDPRLNPYNQSRDLIPKFPDSASSNQQVMYMLADGTGGFVIVNTNDLLGGLEKIGKEQNEYYLLGYTPPESEEGTCHLIKVRVDRGGTKVRFRTGYCNAKSRDALAGNPVEKTLETRAAATQAGDVSASMQAPFFYTSPNVARVNVAMEIATDGVKFEKQKGKLHAAFNVLGIAYLPDGGIAARFSDTVKLDFDEKKQVETFQKKPYHYENQFDVASGKYNLKVVFSSGGESFGKLETPLVVDAYEPKDFSMSSLALSKEARKAADMGLTLDASLLEDRTPLLIGGTQIVPTGSNRFKKSELAIFYVEIYEPYMAAPDPNNPTVVAIQMRILDKAGTQKEDTGLMRIELPKAGGNPVIPLGEKMPVASLGPGAYQLELTAVDMAGKQFRRSADFQIE